MSDLRRVFAQIEAEREHSIGRLIDYVRRPSISAQGRGISEVADYIAGVMTHIGLETEILPTAGWPVVVGRRRRTPGAPTVLMYGHYDVQPPEPLDEWVSPPFEPEVRDGRLYGRGVMDNKGQHLAQLLALEALMSGGEELPCNVTVLLEGEEEIGSPQLAGFVNAHRDLLSADVAITCDGPVLPGGLPCVVFGVRGVLNFELRARGAGSDLHSGNWGGIAPNPLWTLVHLLSSMKNEQGTMTIEGFYDDVQPLTDLEAAAIADLPVDPQQIMERLGIGGLDHPVERGIHERLMGWPTLTINGLTGGYAGPGSKTVLPHMGTAKCDIRLVHAQQSSDILEKVRRHVRRLAPDVEVVPQGAMEPSKTPLDSPYAPAILEALEYVHGRPPLRVPSLGGSLPTYVFRTMLNIPSFVVPYGNDDGANHAPNENIEVTRYVNGIKSSAAMLYSLGRVSTGDSARP